MKATARNRRTELQKLAEDFIKKSGGDIEAARLKFLDEARARYNAEIHGDRAEYWAEVREIFIKALRT